METRLPPDFSAFLRSLNAAGVEYLLVGGYAVGYHGYPRTTGDMDVWVRQSPENAGRLVRAFHLFGFDVPGLAPDLFLTDGRTVRMGVPPNRIGALTSISGVAFEEAWRGRETSEWDGVPVPTIGLRHLRANKQAGGRPKDLADLAELPRAAPDERA